MHLKKSFTKWWPSCLGLSVLSSRWVSRCYLDLPLSFIWSLRADSRFVSSQWETALLRNDVSHWSGTSVELALGPFGIKGNGVVFRTLCVAYRSQLPPDECIVREKNCHRCTKWYDNMRRCMAVCLVAWWFTQYALPNLNKLTLNVQGPNYSKASSIINIIVTDAL